MIRKIIFYFMIIINIKIKFSINKKDATRRWRLTTNLALPNTGNTYIYNIAKFYINYNYFYSSFIFLNNSSEKNSPSVMFNPSHILYIVDILGLFECPATIFCKVLWVKQHIVASLLIEIFLSLQMFNIFLAIASFIFIFTTHVYSVPTSCLLYLTTHG